MICYKRKIIQLFYILLGMLLLLPSVHAQTLPFGFVPPPFTPVDSLLSFKGKSHFYVGDKLEIDLVENLDGIHHREMRVDLWVVVVRSTSGQTSDDNQQWFVIGTGLLNGFSPEPQAFNEHPLETSHQTHRVLDFEVLSGMGGTYNFYAVYVAQDTDPTKDFTVIRSNVATAKITVDDRACVNIPCLVEELPPIENMPKSIELEFAGVEPRYLIGEKIQIDLVEKLETVSNSYHHVDLWVAAVLPNGGQLFFINEIFEGKFTVEQRPFKKALSGLNNYSHRILEATVGEGVGGNYSLHAVYVKTGKNPMKDFTAIVSNAARIQIYLESR